MQTWKVKDDGKAFTSGQRFKADSPHTGQGRKSTATPPYHIHLYQTEIFHVKEGTMCYLIDGKEGKLETGQKADIPPHRPHTVRRIYQIAQEFNAYYAGVTVLERSFDWY